MNDKTIEEALIKLDEFLQTCNPVELGIFKISIGKVADNTYKKEMIRIVSEVLNREIKIEPKREWNQSKKK